MPIIRCQLPNGKQGWKVENGNKCFPTRQQAVKQLQAIKVNQSKGLLERVQDELLKNLNNKE